MLARVNLSSRVRVVALALFALFFGGMARAAATPSLPCGWRLMKQASVTREMGTWARAILEDPATYPMFATTTRAFDGQKVGARVEWHSPNAQHASVHRGVTLYGIEHAHCDAGSSRD